MFGRAIVTIVESTMIMKKPPTRDHSAGHGRCRRGSSPVIPGEPFALRSTNEAGGGVHGRPSGLPVTTIAPLPAVHIQHPTADSGAAKGVVGETRGEFASCALR